MGEQENGAGAACDAALEQKVAKQIEYYFGDMNLMRDRFLKEKMQEDDGWVPIETMLKFNRLRQLTEDVKLICQALKNSSTGLMEVNEAGDKIRRSPSVPLPGDTKERREEITNRSVYAKTFPLDITLDELMTFFEQYGPVDNVFMKRDFHKKTFKGSVFATYTNKEDAAKFVNEEGTKYKDTELESKMYKSEYFKSKNTKRKEGKPEGAKKDDSQKQEDQQQTNEEKAKQQMTKGAVLHLEGLSPDTVREDVKNFFSDFGNVGWVDFEKGDAKGYLRLKDPNSAAPTLEKAKAAGEDGKIIINSQEIQVRVVEGDEELEYWTKMFKDIAEKHKQKKQFRGDRRQGGRNQRGGRRNRGGPQGKRRKNDDDDEDGAEDDDEPVEKAAKVEEEKSAEATAE